MKKIQAINTTIFKFLQHKKQIENNPIQVKNDDNNPLNVPFNMRELNYIIQNLKLNKAPGPDQIHNEMIIHFPEKTRTLLLDIYNYIWLHHVFPQTWREATIIPIKKPNKDQTIPTSYRPIALTNTLCKIMEQLVNNRLVWFLESNNLISNEQIGFRKHRTTTDHHIILKSEIRKAFKNKQHLISIYFDLERAFDTTWRYNIIKNLQNDNVEGNIIHFIKNFLSNRTFKVKSHGCISTKRLQENGTPQGSPLSATLFLKAIDSVTKQINFPIKALLYADDLLIFRRGKHIQIIEKEIQKTIRKIEIWMEKTGFTLSTAKTKAIHFTKMRKNHPQPHIKLNNNNIPFVEHIKLLGLIFDRKLTWKKHITELKAACLKKLNILKTISSYSWGAHEKSMLTIYKMIIRSKIDFGSIAYQTAAPRHLKKLDVIQNSALRLATGAFRTSPIKSLLNLTTEKPLSIRRSELTLKYVIKIASNHQHPTYPQIYRNNNNKQVIRNTTPLHTKINKAIETFNITLPKKIQDQYPSKTPPLVNN